MEGGPDPGGVRRQVRAAADTAGPAGPPARGRPEIGLAIELKHPSPFQLKLEDRVLEVLAAQGWDPATSMLDNIRVSFMSFSPDSVQHLLESVPAEAVCQLVDDVNVAESGRNSASVPSRAGRWPTS